MTGGSVPRIGPYELLMRIGKGGMASVYLARLAGAEGFTRVYAVKVMHPNFNDQPEMVDMLMDEARLASRLNHPNVVATVDLGVDQGHYYLVMDYVEGIALDRLVRKNPGGARPELVVQIAIDALQGLGAAHELEDEHGQLLELVHRDVTPGNVIVDVDGNALIADFGVAKARARITKTMPGLVKGKAGYVAPEVALGKPIDGRADVFSMGVLLFNVLTGESLYDTDDLGKSIRELVQKEVPPPSTVGRHPPAIFDQPILTALARDPDQRHVSAREMAEALEDALTLHRGLVPRREVADWVYGEFSAIIEERRRISGPDSPAPEADAGADGIYRVGPGLFPDEPDADEDAPTMIAGIDIDVSFGEPGPPLESTRAIASLPASTIPPPSLDDELERELQKERSQQRVLLGFAVLLLAFAIGVSGWIGWRAYQRSLEQPEMRAHELAE